MRKDSFGLNALEKLDPQGQVPTNNWFSTLVLSHDRQTTTEDGITQHTRAGQLLGDSSVFLPSWDSGCKKCGRNPVNLWYFLQPESQQGRDGASPSSSPWSSQEAVWT